MTVTPRMPATITLPVGQLLIVRAGAESRGAIWSIPPTLYGKRSIVAWVESTDTQLVGPFKETKTFRVEAILGELEYETQDLIVAQLEDQISRIKSATVIAKALNERKPMSDTQSALDKVDAAAATPAPAKRPVAPGSFAASIRAMMDEARAGVVQARQEGLDQVKGAVAKLDEAKTATKQVAGQMAKMIQDEAADVMAELGQISNMPPE